MTIKTQLRIFAAVIIMIPLLCLLSIRGYRHYSAVQRTFLKDFRRIESNTTINISSEDWDVLLNAVRNMEPDIEAALIIQDVVQVSTMEELKENQIIREKELWNFVRDTGFKYAYRFEIPPADIPSQKGVMLLSRVARQKDGDIQHAVPLVILTFSLIFIMMCMLTIFTISHSIFSSLMLLKKQTQKIADGDLDAPIEIPAEGMKTNEITQFLSSLERMRTSLLEAKSRQSLFVMGISHDLRTPVAVIKGYTEAMLDGIMTSKEEVASALKIISVKTAQLQSMLDTLINYERFKTKDMNEVLRPQKLGPLLIGFARNAEATGTIFHKNISYSVDLDHDFAVPINEQLLLRAFENILSNAMRHTNDGGSIILRAFERQDCIELSIEDTGSGIEPKDIEHIFDLFYRGTNSRREEGMGIGLAVVKNIIDLHGWNIEVESAKNVGTKFIITVPKERLGEERCNS